MSKHVVEYTIHKERNKVFKQKWLEPYLFEFTNIATGKVDFYRFAINNRYIKTEKRFKTLDEALQYKTMCMTMISQQNFEHIKCSEYNEKLETYPNNLFIDLDIPFDEYTEWEMTGRSQEKLEEYLAFLDKRSKAIVVSYYNGGTLEYVGKAFNVTRERIRQIIAKSLKRMKHKKTVNLAVVERKNITDEEYFKAKAIIKQYEEEHKTVKKPKYDNELFNRETDTLPLSVRPTNSLRRNGYRLVGDVANATIAELQQIRGMGKKSLDEIIKVFRKIGIRLN